MQFRKKSLRQIALVLTVTFSAGGLAQPAPGKPSMEAAKLHQKLVNRSIGKGIKVTEVDGTVVSGVLVSIDADSFQITPKNASHPLQVMNTAVAKLGNTGLSTGAKVAIGVAIGIAIVILYVVISFEATF